MSEDVFCENCGDMFDENAENASIGKPHGTWRPCPSPSPGEPLKDCGIGGHMYRAKKRTAILPSRGSWACVDASNARVAIAEARSRVKHELADALEQEARREADR